MHGNTCMETHALTHMHGHTRWTHVLTRMYKHTIYTRTHDEQTCMDSHVWTHMYGQTHMAETHVWTHMYGHTCKDRHADGLPIFICPSNGKWALYIFVI